MQKEGVDLAYSYNNYHNLGRCKHFEMVSISFKYLILFDILDSIFSIHFPSNVVSGDN